MGNLDARRENGPVLRLGELAVRAGLLSEPQLNRALAQQQQEAKQGRLPRQLGLILLSFGFLDETDLIKLLSEQEKQKNLVAKMQAPAPQPSARDFAAQPEPPDRIEFSCTCGKILSAPRHLYDRRSKCGICHTVLLLNLVYRRDLNQFEIEPFRIGGALGA